MTAVPRWRVRLFADREGAELDYEYDFYCAGDIFAAIDFTSHDFREIVGVTSRRLELCLMPEADQ